MSRLNPAKVHVQFAAGSMPGGPLTLLQHPLQRHAVPDWVHQQVYLRPYTKELMLRNHV
jgi:uncharacterized protein YbgA (DUF1722 family)